ncbi:MAG: NADH dehydrogenase [Lachnospiraceae bacterium]|nr:NADH dehydrogenase [Lachnospiraceae bacterium]
MEGNISILFAVLWPMIGALACFIAGRMDKKLRDYLAVFVTGIELVLFIILFTKVWNGGELYFVLHDFCARGLWFRLDGFRVSYALITALMWMMATIFSKEYLKKERNRNRFYFFLLLTLGATIGVFASDDLFTTFIFFEIMSLSSFVWVIQEEKKEAIKAAETYLAIAIIGGLAMLMGLFLLYSQTGTLAFGELYHALQMAENKAVIYIAGACMLVGFGAKAGMFPLHVWLPKSHPVAPAPASALLSGILLKTGVFGILVMTCNIFAYDYNWAMVILICGTLTMAIGAILAVFQVNLKSIIACSSMSQIGFILVGVGMQGLLGEHNQLAVRGTYLHMVNHSVIKLVLFMGAGVIVMNLHKLDLNKIRGFGRKKPALLFAFLMGAIGISGIPLFNGYVSKTLLHESIVEYGEVASELGISSFITGIEWIFLISGGFTFAYMLKIFIALFIEKNDDQAAMDAYNKKYMNKQSTFALISIAVCIPVMGMAPGIVMDKMADFAQGFMHGHELHHAVHYFSLENLKGAAISLSIGAIVYVVLVRMVLMKKRADGVKEYVYVWPTWMDLENSSYRPVIGVALPFVGAVVCRIADKTADGCAALLANTVLRPARNRRPLQYCSRFTYIVGDMLDGIVAFLNRTVCKKKPLKFSFVNFFTVSTTEVRRTSTLITRSVSFGLLLFCIGLLMTLVYLLIVA